MTAILQSQTFWAVVSGIVAIVTLLAQIFLPVYRARKTLSYKVLYDGPPNREIHVGEELTAPGSARAVDANRVVDIKLHNHGTVDIERTHFERSITIGFGREAEILNARVVGEEPAGIGASIHMLPDGLQLNDVLLNRGDSIRLVALLRNSSDRVVEVDGRIVGISRIVDRTTKTLDIVYIVRSALAFSAILLAIGLLGLILRPLDQFAKAQGFLSSALVGFIVTLAALSLLLILINLATRRIRRNVASQVAQSFRDFFSKRGSLFWVVSDFVWETYHEDTTGYKFDIKCFNERKKDFGVRDVMVAFFRDGAKVAEDRPTDAVDGYSVDYLNLPSRQWISKRLTAGAIVARPEELREARDCDEVQLIMHYPDGKEFRVDVPIVSVGGAQTYVSNDRS